MEELERIKYLVAKMKKHQENKEWLEVAECSFQLFEDGYLDWLIEQVEKDKE